MTNEYSNKKKMSLKDKAKYALTSTVAGAYALACTGCASMNIRPVMNASTDDAGNLEAKAGVVFTGDASDNPEFHGGFCREACQTVFGPFHVYRAKDGKWFPEWREHPYRTTGMTVLYIGAGVAASQSKGKSSSKPADNSGDTGGDNGGDSGDDTKPTPTPDPGPGGSGD